MTQKEFDNAPEYTCKRHAITVALHKADKGRFISSEAMGAWVDSWGLEEEHTPPEVDVDIKIHNTLI